MQCQGIIAEQTVPIGSETVETTPARVERQKLQDAVSMDVEVSPQQTEEREVDGQVVSVVVRPAQYEQRETMPEIWGDVVVAPAEYERIIQYETTPEHRCEREATQVARSMTEQSCNLGGIHWVKDGPDRAYCSLCFVPGTMTHADGRTSQHPHMAIDQYEEADRG